MKKTCEYPECGCDPIRALECPGISGSDVYQLWEHLIKIRVKLEKDTAFDDEGRYIYNEFPGQQ